MSHNIDHIFFINLDKRPDRLAEIEEELKAYDLTAERFAAHYHPTIGLVGCTKSHVACLKMAKERGYKRVLILEDDFHFLVDKVTMEEQLSLLFDQQVPFDVCMLAYNLIRGEPSTEYPFLQRVREAYTASAYIIQDHYYDTLIHLWEWANPQLEATNHHWIYANDQIWKQLQEKDTFYCYTMRLGKQRPSFSDNNGNFVDSIF
jgi:GR25 family glycosyltransferase involved in LPS biosynthesis